MTERQYCCPSCGFRIFNRRLATCERCGATLPSELLFSREEIDALDADHEQSSEKWRVKDDKPNANGAIEIIRLPGVGGDWGGGD